MRNDDAGGASAGRASPRDTRVALISDEGLDLALYAAADALAGLGNAAMGAGIGAAPGQGQGAGPSAGNGSGRGRGRLARTRWVRMPTNNEMKPYWPVTAVAAKLSGRAILECVVPSIGPPTSCRALTETPLGSGSGQAAVTMSPIFRIMPVTRTHQVEDMPIIVPVTFTCTGR